MLTQQGATRRTLEASQPIVAVVSSPQELRDALNRGEEHIEVQAHLDLTSLQPADNKDDQPVLFSNAAASEANATEGLSRIRSFRGNCKGPPAAEMTQSVPQPPLLPLQSRQCLLIVDMRLLDIRKTFGDTQDAWWMDGLYVRYKRTRRVGPYAGGLVRSARPAYITAVTMQGDGSRVPDGITGSLFVDAPLHANGCTFASFEGLSTAYVSRSKPVSFRNCRFKDNNATTGTILANGQYTDSFDPVIVRLEGCEFGHASRSHLATHLWPRGSAPVFFSDVDRGVLHFGRSISGPAPTSKSWTDTAPLSGISALEQARLLSTGDRYFQELQLNLSSIPGRQQLAVDGGGYAHGGAWGASVAIMCALVATLLMGLSLGVFAWRRRRRYLAGASAQSKKDLPAMGLASILDHQGGKCDNQAVSIHEEL